MTVYFDNAATTMVCPEAAQAVMEALTGNYGNPSSGYKLGRDAAQKLREARESVAAALGAKSDEVYFTSGGTESDNWAIRSSVNLMRHAGKHIITGAAEHDAVRHTMQTLENAGYEVTYLKPDKSGKVTVEQVMDALREDTVLISLMLVNNEIGSINPIEDIVSALRSAGSKAIIHTDAVQGFLKVPFTPKKLGVDLVSISSHKIHGPKGTGALYIRQGLRLPGMITGGAQEGGIRPGTEAMPAIMGFGAAAKVGKANFNTNITKIREIKEYTLKKLKENLPEMIVIGESEAPHIVNISLPGYKSEVLMNYLDSAGICVSKSSACKRGARSHVLEAMNLPAAVIDGAIRISFSRFNTNEEADYFVKNLTEAAGKLRTQKR